MCTRSSTDLSTNVCMLLMHSKVRLVNFFFFGVRLVDLNELAYLPMWSLTLLPCVNLGLGTYS